MSTMWQLMTNTNRLNTALLSHRHIRGCDAENEAGPDRQQLELMAKPNPPTRPPPRLTCVTRPSGTPLQKCTISSNETDRKPACMHPHRRIPSVVLTCSFLYQCPNCPEQRRRRDGKEACSARWKGLERGEYDSHSAFII